MIGEHAKALIEKRKSKAQIFGSQDSTHQLDRRRFFIVSSLPYAKVSTNKNLYTLNGILKYYRCGEN